MTLLPTRATVLLVDDDPRVLAGLRRQLHRHYDVLTADSGSEGLDLLNSGPPVAVVVSDMRMPGMDGAAFLARARLASPQTTRILLTGQTEIASTIRAINDGRIFRFLYKPCPPDVLQKALQDAVTRHDAARDEHRMLISVLGDRRVRESHRGDEAMAEGLRIGLDNQEFRLHYQPIVAVASGLVVAVEALVRWAHPDAGLISAASFVPVAETSGLILPLGRWGVTDACQEVASWPALNATESLQLHINISGAQLGDPRLVDDLASALLLSGLPPHRVVLEIDDTTALDDPAIADALRTVAGHGTHLALGVSARPTDLPALTATAPFDMVKISRHFNVLLPTDTSAREIYRSIVAAANDLRLRTVAEGIETVEHQKAITDLGCDLAQGHLYGYPTAPGELLSRLIEGGNP